MRTIPNTRIRPTAVWVLKPTAVRKGRRTIAGARGDSGPIAEADVAWSCDKWCLLVALRSLAVIRTSRRESAPRHRRRRRIWRRRVAIRAVATGHTKKAVDTITGLVGGQ